MAKQTVKEMLAEIKGTLEGIKAQLILVDMRLTALENKDVPAPYPIPRPMCPAPKPQWAPTPPWVSPFLYGPPPITAPTGHFTLLYEE